MKKGHIFLVALFLVNFANAQWTVQPNNTHENLYSVWFTDEMNGFITGEETDNWEGLLLKTTDGGVTWSTQIFDTLKVLSSIRFVNASTGFINGDYLDGSSKILMKTTDGGITWNSYKLSYEYLYPIYFIDANTGFAVIHSSIVKTTNGGKDWITVFVHEGTRFLRDIMFINSYTGFAIGDGSEFAKTTDGGNNWTGSLIGYPDIDLSSVFFTNSNVGYAVGYKNSTGHGTINKTIDGGVTWSTKSLDMTSPDQVYFTDLNTGYIVGSDYPNNQFPSIMKTINGGLTWFFQDSPNNPWLMSVFFVSPNIGYTVGFSGVILKTTNGGGNPSGIDDMTYASNTIKIYPTPSSSQVNIETSAIPTKGQLSIMNPNGQELISRQVSGLKTVIDISSLSSGVYVVKLIGEKGVQVGKFIKE